MKTLFALLLVFLLLPAPASGSGDAAQTTPVWWPDALAQADRDGYELVGHDALQSLGTPGEDFLLIDVRPDYEFEAGHIPGAVNFEFDLGDRQGLSPEKRQKLEDFFKTHPERPAVFYCRSFR